MRHRAKPRTQERFGSQPAVNQWKEIQEMSLHQFAQRCKKSALVDHLVVEMRDLDQSARHWSSSVRRHV